MSSECEFYGYLPYLLPSFAIMGTLLLNPTTNKQKTFQEWCMNNVLTMFLIDTSAPTDANQPDSKTQQILNEFVNKCQ